jgi:hypothetical protein
MQMLFAKVGGLGHDNLGLCEGFDGRPELGLAGCATKCGRLREGLCGEDQRGSQRRPGVGVAVVEHNLEAER